MIDLEQTLNYFLQRDITFTIDDKVVKRGKLILCNIKDFYITFYLKHNDDQKRYELPYPFALENTNRRVTMDYTLESVAGNNTDLLYKLQSLSRKKNTKIFNSKVVIAEV
jgi:hypothetical protein